MLVCQLSIFSGVLFLTFYKNISFNLGHEVRSWFWCLAVEGSGKVADFQSGTLLSHRNLWDNPHGCCCSMLHWLKCQWEINWWLIWLSVRRRQIIWHYRWQVFLSSGCSYSVCVITIARTMIDSLNVPFDYPVSSLFPHLTGASTLSLYPSSLWVPPPSDIVDTIAL